MYATYCKNIMKTLIIIIIVLVQSLQLIAQKCNGLVLNKKGYTACYVDSLGHSSWVKWELSATDLGHTERSNDFQPDRSLPAHFYMVIPTDYRNTGFDKGHLCNSADRTSSEELNEETFLMTNMIPQSPHNNEITWKGLENHCRDLAKHGYKLHIIAGAYGIGGEGSKGIETKIAERITVPSNTWKIVKYTKDNITDNIFVDMPNNQTLNKDWQTYQTTQIKLEHSTGLHFSDFLK